MWTVIHSFGLAIPAGANSRERERGSKREAERVGEVEEDDERREGLTAKDGGRAGQTGWRERRARESVMAGEQGEIQR